MKENKLKYKNMMDKLNSMDNKIADFRNKIQDMKQELNEYCPKRADNDVEVCQDEIDADRAMMDIIQDICIEGLLEREPEGDA